VPDPRFGPGHRQLGVVAASVVGVVAVVAAVGLVGHPWRNTAAQRLAAAATGRAISSASSLASSPPSAPAVSASLLASAAAPPSSPTATNGSPAAPSTTPAPSRPSPSDAGVAADKQLNFKVNLQVSPTHAVVGQKVRVTVTVVNAGEVFNGPVVMSFGGTDPSDNTADAQPPCKAAYGSVSCPITGIRPGRSWSFTFSFIPGDFPAMVHFDDAVFAVFDYTNSDGQQQTPQYIAHVLLSNPSSSAPPASGSVGSTSPAPASQPPASVRIEPTPTSGS
jgi:hypothetical protein